MALKITEAQKAAVRESLVPYFDYGGDHGPSTGYLRFCPLSTEVFPHGLSIGVRFPIGAFQGDIESAKDKVTEFLVDAFEHLLR